MTVYEERTLLSRYRELYPLKEDGTVQLVRDDRTGELFVKKTLDVCRRDVCLSLVSAPVAGMPRIRSLTPMGEQTVLIEDYVNGRTLQNLLDEKHTLSEEYALTVFHSVADTVRLLHARTPAVIHRDIKPDNIILCADGRIFLTDIDAAKPFEPGIVRDTVLFGTAGYAAPEQYGFGGSDVRTDVYALGVLLNVMVTGALPTEIPAGGKIGELVEKATRMDPAGRYTSVEEMLTDAFGRTSKENKKPKLRFLPPGMRSGDPVKIALAGVGYAFLIWTTVNLSFEDAATPGDMLMNRISFLAGALLAIFFCGDYLGVRSEHLFKNVKSRAVYVLLTVLIAFFLFFLPFLVLSGFKH